MPYFRWPVTAPLAARIYIVYDNLVCVQDFRLTELFALRMLNMHC